MDIWHFRGEFVQISLELVPDCHGGLSALLLRLLVKLLLLLGRETPNDVSDLGGYLLYPRMGGFKLLLGHVKVFLGTLEFLHYRLLIRERLDLLLGQDVRESLALGVQVTCLGPEDLSQTGELMLG